MAPKRDWVDYVNVGANVIQTAQLDGINSKIREMARIELMKEFREQQEAVVAERENLLREMVFTCSEHLRNIEESSGQNPAQAYIRATHAKRLYEQVPQMKTSEFRQFEDKERLANALRSYDRFIRENAARLKPEELKECDQCVEHIFNRPELLKLISAQELAEDVGDESQTLSERQRAKEAELVKLEEQQASTAFNQGLTTVCGACAFISFCGLATGGLVSWSTVNDTTETPWLIPLSLIVGFISTFAYAILKSSSPNYPKQIAVLKGEINAIKQSVVIKKTEADQHKALCEKFGVAKTNETRHLLLERDTLLEKMVGDYAKDVVTKASPVVTSFEITLVAVPDDKKISVIKALIDAKPGLGLAEAKTLAEGVMPCLVTRCDTKEEAEKIAALFDKAGGQIVIKKCIS